SEERKSFFNSDGFKVNSIGTISGGSDVNCPNLNAGDTLEVYLQNIISRAEYEHVRGVSPETPFPNPPTLLTATRSPLGTQVSLTWTPVPGAIEYEIWRNSSGTNLRRYFTHTLVDTTTSTNYTEIGLDSDGGYYYRVTVRTADGQSRLSNSIRSSQSTAAPDLTITPLGGSIQLDWTAVSGATGYRIEYKSIYNSVLNGPIIVDLGVVLTHTIIGLDNDTIYDFTVYAILPGDQTSQEASLVRTCPRFPRPELLTAIPGDSEVELTWTAVSGATSYGIRKKLSTDAEYGPPIDTGGAVTNFTVVGLINNLTYDFVVFSKNGLEESQDSSPLSATPTS
ncbi:MAG TPA: hypothetical protein VLB82_03745, partial [Thermodesulfobacteriota bacterium]|nr:hypothetical protein [Thermodesulfobacteriota bacterium]